jgi:hypothetical protein
MEKRGSPSGPQLSSTINNSGEASADSRSIASKALKSYEQKTENRMDDDVSDVSVVT